MADERIKVILDIDAEVSKARSNISNLTKVFDNIGGTKGGQLREILSQIGTEYDKLAEQSGKAMGKVGDFSKAEKSSEKLNSLFKKLGSELNNIGKSSGKELEKLFPDEIANRIQKANEAIKTYNSSMKKSESGKGAINQATQAYQKQIDVVNKLEQEIRQLEEAKKGGTPVNATIRDAQKQRTKEAEKAYTAQLAKTNIAEKARDDYAVQQELTDKTRMKSSTYRAKNKTYNEEFKRAEELRVAFEQAKAVLDKMYVPETVDKEINDIKARLEEAKNKATEFKDNLGNVKTTEINKALDEAKKKLQDLTGIDLSQIGNIDDLNNLLQRFTTEGVDGLKKGLQDAGIQVKELGTANDQVGAKIENCTNDVKNQNAALEDINGLKSRIQYFFSLTNTVMLARRAIQQTFETVKELDAAMTETAVVTDFSVGDMWDQLPEYTETAKQLGVSIQGVYEASTLYYQQGLRSNEVATLTTETLKMARIAGLDCAEATDLMTAALRGFNMELNEDSASRINDVYSKLAAITAADTEEIATAMTKTASIASNANMEFETTAALLSQIIETTREPAETAGTAMKTIIARFTEMKKATSDVINVDGEEISVNKVEAALKSAGVALRDVNGEFRDLDDVFLELSSKWNGLDKMTQRYVATMAAGSRQQSRFIAMMQNYDRSVELVDAAYDSAGASSMQFGKTQDSLESKLARLEASWQEFLMGISNSDAIKTVVDALTGLLDILNKGTTGASDFATFMSRMFVVVGGLSIGKQIFNKMFASIGAQMGLGGQQAGQKFNSGISTTLGKGISFKDFGKKIVNSVETKSLNKKVNGAFKDISKTIAKNGEISGKDFSEQLAASLSTDQLKASASTIGTTMESALGAQLQSNNLTDEGQTWARSLIDGYVNTIRTTGDPSKATKELEQKITNDLNSSDASKYFQNGSAGLTQAQANLGMIKTDEQGQPLKGNANINIDKNTVKNSAKLNTNLIGAGMALSAAGMAGNMLASALEEGGVASKELTDGINVASSSLTTTGSLLMTLTSLQKMFNITTAANPYIALAAVLIGVITAVASGIGKAKERQEELNKATVDKAHSLNEEVKANRELIKTLDETIEGYREGVNSRQDVAEAADELLTLYGLEDQKAKLLTGDYKDLAEAIRDKARAEEEANLKAQKNAITASRGQLAAKKISDLSNLSYGWSTADEANSDSFKKDAKKILEKYKISASVGDAGVLSFTKNIMEMTDQEITDLYHFLNEYTSLMASELGDKAGNSEVYNQLSQILQDTGEDFANLEESVNNAAISLRALADSIYEEDYSAETVKTRSDYLKQREIYESILQQQDPNISAEEKKEQTDRYFGSFNQTMGYVAAEGVVEELKETKIQLENVQIYQDYVNGKIGPEAFTSFVREIDFQNIATAQELNEAVIAQTVKTAIDSPYLLQSASKGIQDYINENFTLEGIPEEELLYFETNLKTINETLPNTYDLMGDWEKALQGGTLAVSQFMSDVQGMLSNRSLLLQQAALNQTAYGINLSDDDILSIYNEYKNKTKDEKERIASRYKVSWAAFEAVVESQGKSYKQQLADAYVELDNAKAAFSTEDETLKKKYEERWGTTSPLKKPDGTQDYKSYTEDGVTYYAIEGSLKYEKAKQLENIESMQDGYETAVTNSQIRINNEEYLKDHPVDAALEVVDYVVDGLFGHIGKMREQRAESRDATTITNYVNAVNTYNDLIDKIDQNTIAINERTNELQNNISKKEGKIKAIEEGQHIKKQLEINLAVNNAESLITLQTQLMKIKELTEGGMQVDVSTFNELVAITPEIAAGAEVLEDGTINIANGMEILNNKLAEEIGLKKETVEATLLEAQAQEEAYQTKLQQAIDAIDIELERAKKAENGKVEISEETAKTLLEIQSDEAFERATLADQEAEDMSDSAKEGATNVINSVSSIQDAYVELGGTLDTINKKMRTMGTHRYDSTVVANSINGKITAPDSVDDENPTKDDYSIEDFKDTDYESKVEYTVEELENLKLLLETQQTNSFGRGAYYTSLLSQVRGGGSSSDDTKDGGGSGSTNIVKESDKIKAKIDEIDSAIKELTDNDIVDMRMVNQLISQKIALQKEYKKALEKELIMLSASTDEIWSQVKKEGNDKYIEYSDETGGYQYTDAYYDDFFKNGIPIDSEQMQKVQEQMNQLNQANSDQLSNQVAIRELVDQLVENQAENYNAERALKGRERRQTEADAEEELIGMLPEEIQPFFQALNTAEDAYLEMQEIQANKVLAENLQQQLDASYAGVPDYIKENMTFDEYSGYGIDLAKINQIEDKEAREEMLTAVQENAKILNEQYFDPLYDVKEQLSGGKLQKGILTTAKALKDFAKEVSDNDFNDGLLKVETGFKALDEALNGLIERIENSELVDEFLNKKAIGGLGLGDKERDALLSNEKLVEFLGKSGLGPIVSEIGWGEGATNGELLSLANGFMGGALEQIGGFLNFDMMKILGDSGGLIEQGKQIVEQIVGKIAEITGALIDAWTNREDILYNFLNVLEKYLHDYEVMQRYSTQLEKGRMASVDDIRQNWEQQWQSLQDQLEMQQERIETRQDQLDRSRWNPFQLISGWDPTSDSLYENRGVKMAFDLLISAIGMLPMGLGAFGGQLNQLYEDYDKRVQEAYEDRLAAEMAILDIEDERLELVKIGAEEATEFEQKVLDALVQKEQEQIEELSRLNDAITGANSKLISTLQKNLDQIRQDRENEKKEEELGEKERRLAYLRQDTSGANMMEIKKLEEELEEGHEDYTDTLIDQKISELEKQNEAAAEQRQQQIDLLQAQLDWSQKYGLYWDAIYGMLYTIDENGNAVLNPENFDLDGNIRENSQLAQMLGTFSDRLGMSVWSSVLDNEEAKRLGRYYGAFIGNNGISGEWADYWALLNPGADDPDYATPMPEIPDGIWGVLYRIETSIGKYFGSSNMGLWNAGERLEVGLKNILGDVFNIEEWANATAKGFHREDVIGKNTLTLMNGWNKLSEGLLGIADFGNKTSQSLTNRAGYNRHQNNGDNNISNYFNIGTVGENISLDDMVDKVSSALREVFSAGTNIVHHGR